MYLDRNRLAISDTTYHGLLWKPDLEKQISQEILASHNQRTRLLQFTAISFLRHCPGVMLTVTAKAANRAIGAASTWPRHLQHPFLCGPCAWHLPKGLDFFMPSLCSQALNIKQQPSYLFPQGLISLFKRSSSTKCKELSAAQLIQSSPKSQQPCSGQIFVCY